MPVKKSNAIQSMTGFGRAMRNGAKGSVSVELRSTNHRYLEIDQRLSNGLSSIQGFVAETLRQHLKRGRVEVSVAVHSDRGSRKRPVFDEELAQRYHELLIQLQSRFGLKGQVSLDHLLSFPNIITLTEDRVPIEEMTETIHATVQTAVQDLLDKRRKEATRLTKDLRNQIASIEKHARVVVKRLPVAMREERDRLRKRLRVLLGAKAVSSVQQLEEALALIKEADVNEEVVRLQSHLKHLRQTLTSPGPIGKLVDFIAQELTRETNTLGAKVNDADAARSVVAMKECIEKIREQAQNLE